MNFRRWITALAVLALFAGFASAQVTNSSAGSGALQCAASVAVPPTLRAEGLTELVGDIVLTCSGGPTPVVGTAISTANFTVSFGTNVTSRLLTYSSLNPNLQTTNTSEALLLIDEPGSGLLVPNSVAGIGPAAPQTLCGSGGVPYSLVGAGPTGCTQYVALAGGVDYTMVSAGGGPAANVYAGVVSSNQVTFYGIPVLPPTSSGVSRVFRMTNIRINANTLYGGGLSGTTPVLASISISAATSIPVNTPVQTVGFVQAGLSTSVRNIGNSAGQTTVNQNQCSSAGNPSVPVVPLDILRFSKNFGTAFKPRTSAGVYPTSQNIPGQIYNSESGFILGLFNSGALGGTTPATYSYAGLADYGTRLKAVFNNIPAGVQIFVSTSNIVNLTGASSSTGNLAEQVISDTASDGGLATTSTLPLVPATAYYPPSSQWVSYSQLSVVNGSATAVWEVVNTNPATLENFDFGVLIAYTASPSTNTPPPGTATVNLSFAPIPPVDFTAAAGGMASGTLTIPRFADTSTAVSIVSIVQCSTSLLFPFVTNQGGFDTGIALMNTTSDPFGTKPQAGTCALNFYGQNAPPLYTTASIPSGNNTASSTYAFLASSIAPNFQGYVIAVCQFQLAHGYAFISDLGAQKLAEGYLALILNNITTSVRPPTPANTVSSSSVEMLEN
jgi:hypothetical protein